MKGVVGAFWGIYDVHRNPKFSFQGPIRSDAAWYSAMAAVLSGVLLVLLYLRAQPSQPFSGRLFFALLLQTTASVFVWVIASPLFGEFLFWETFIWALLLPMQAGLLLIILVNGFEMSEMIWPEGLKRRFRPLPPAPERQTPRVSIHVPICKEPPDMVISTLNGLAALDYPNVEVLVIDNNNPHPELWQPVQAHCETLGPRFRFFHLDEDRGIQGGGAELRAAARRTRRRKSWRWSTATTSSAPTGSSCWCPISSGPRSGWCRRPRIIAAGRATSSRR